MKERKKDLINYRIERSKETIGEAKVLAENNQWNGCVNRLYYACFYMVNALLLHESLSANTHSGVKSFFNQYFIKTGKLSKQYGQLYNALFDDRQESDYQDFVEMKSSYVKPLIKQVENFITDSENLINTNAQHG